MSGDTFALHRAPSVEGRRGEVLSWVGNVAGLGRIELMYPTEYSDYPSEYREVAVRGERFPLTTYLGLGFHGAVDSVDISLAILFEGVYTRNLSFRGALISAPGRFMDSVSKLS